MSLLNKFKRRSNLSPLEKLASDAGIQINRRLENSVEDLFAGVLRSSGLSASISRELSARFGDAVVGELADKYFQTSSSAYERASKEDICNNFLPGYADTSSSEVRRVQDNQIEVDGAGSILQFPNQIGKYYMSMSFRKYVRQAPQVQTSLEFDNAIVLPVPKRLEENFSLDVSSAKQGTAGAYGDFLQRATSRGFDSASETAGDAATARGYAFAVRTLGELSTEASQTLGTFLGAIPNPHLAAIFDGVQLRQHNFEWTFAPRNPEESAALQNIILKLKQNSLPAFSSLGSPILQYPLMCQIKMQPWERQGAELIKYKPALLQDVRVNYAPNGIPSFFAGTTLPTFIQISLTFVETTYFTSNDFGRSGAKDDVIGETFNAAVGELDSFIPGASDAVRDALDTVDGVVADVARQVREGESDQDE